MIQIYWSLLAAFIIALILYTIASIKNIKLMQAIVKIFFIPLLSSCVILMLQVYLPDAHHIIRVTIVATAAIFLNQFFHIFIKNRVCELIGIALFLFSIGTWLNLYATTFYIYYVHRISIVIGISAYAIFLLTLLIISGKQSRMFYITSLLCFIPAAFLNFCAIVTLVQSRRSYSYLLTAGTLMLLIFIMFYMLKKASKFKINDRIYELIQTAIYTVAQVLITVSGLLMIM